MDDTEITILWVLFEIAISFPYIAVCALGIKALTIIGTCIFLFLTISSLVIAIKHMFS